MATAEANHLFTVADLLNCHKMNVDPVLRTSSSNCVLSSTTSFDGAIIDVPPAESAHPTVTSVLSYCKSKILNPYLRLLSIIGLRPLVLNQREPCLGWQVLNYFYAALAVAVMVVGYLLQYMACFRRDRGFSFESLSISRSEDEDIGAVHAETCRGPLLFSFIIPSCLHLSGYLHAVLVIRNSDEDQLQILMERVFLTSATISNGLLYQKRLVRVLWTFVVLTGVWMSFSLLLINVMMVNGQISFKWMGDGYSVTFLKIMLVVSTLWHDIVQAGIISNYCLQTQLLISYLRFLREKLMQYPIQPLEWIRHIETFKRMLVYINEKIAPSICVFTFMNLVWASAGLVWFFNYDNTDVRANSVGVSALNIVLWIIIVMAPFLQAARLSSACNVLRYVGQEVRTRPFVHQDTPGHELDSILMYTASLKLRAKLFCIPISGKYLSLIFTLASMSLLILGQCHYLSVN